jgi:nucleotide-binding universal stress UspA family protein
VTAPPLRVLVAVEHPADCEAGLRYAVHQAERTGATLDLIHVTPPEDRTVDHLAPARTGLAAHRGSPAVVTSHHRRSRLRRLAHGSTAVAVAGRVHCRTVSVPTPGGGESRHRPT